jgi:hypothetical protein
MEEMLARVVVRYLQAAQAALSLRDQKNSCSMFSATGLLPTGEKLSIIDRGLPVGAGGYDTRNASLQRGGGRAARIFANRTSAVPRLWWNDETVHY